MYYGIPMSVGPSVRFTCRTLTLEPLGQFTSNFTELLELMVLRSVYFMVKFWIFIPELWDFIGWNFNFFSQQPCVWWKCYMVGMCLIWPLKKFLFSLFLEIGNQSPTGYHGENIKIILWIHSHLKANLVVMFIGWPVTKYLFFVSIAKKTKWENKKILRTRNLIELVYE
jgi:hypothetical protein